MLSNPGTAVAVLWITASCDDDLTSVTLERVKDGLSRVTTWVYSRMFVFTISCRLGLTVSNSDCVKDNWHERSLDCDNSVMVRDISAF